MLFDLVLSLLNTADVFHVLVCCGLLSAATVKKKCALATLVASEKWQPFNKGLCMRINPFKTRAGYMLMCDRECK